MLTQKVPFHLLPISAKRKAVVDELEAYNQMDQLYQCVLGTQGQGPFPVKLKYYSKIWLRKTYYFCVHTNRDVNE